MNQHVNECRCMSLHVAAWSMCAIACLYAACKKKTENLLLSIRGNYFICCCRVYFDFPTHLTARITTTIQVSFIHCCVYSIICYLLYSRVSPIQNYNCILSFKTYPHISEKISNENFSPIPHVFSPHPLPINLPFPF
jgi:hypothetical protein